MVEHVELSENGNEVKKVTLEEYLAILRTEIYRIDRIADLVISNIWILGMTLSDDFFLVFICFLMSLLWFGSYMYKTKSTERILNKIY